MLVFILSALASPPIPVTVEVVDAEKAPVTTATLSIEGEDVAHQVHTETGMWTATGIVDKEGERPFERGQVVELTVEAEGYAPQTVSYTVRKKKNRLRVLLDADR
jgi:hypothetical protein